MRERERAQKRANMLKYSTRYVSVVLCMCQWCCVSGVHVSVVLCMCQWCYIGNGYQWCYACVSGVVYVSVVLYR